jgi:hydrogenase nickel incorporation protein HypA/HybF
MHELSIALSIVDAAAEEAARNGAARVTAVHLKLGEMSGVVPEALRSAWDLATEDSPIAGAELKIDEEPATAICETCGGARRIKSISEMACRECGAHVGELVSGRALEVTGIEIIEEEKSQP